MRITPPDTTPETTPQMPPAALNFQPRKPNRYRPRPADPSPTPPPAPAPTLVAATCDESPSLTLTFDRPINVSAIDVARFRVDDGPLGFTYVGYDAPIVVNPTTVQILLTGTEEYTGPGVILTAAAGNGIAAAEGGAAWAGVANLALPFGV
jgi:hypothetical protein